MPTQGHPKGCPFYFAAHGSVRFLFTIVGNGHRAVPYGVDLKQYHFAGRRRSFWRVLPSGHNRSLHWVLDGEGVLLVSLFVSFSFWAFCVMMEKRGAHMKTIVVMKNRSHRIFALIMGVATALVPVITSVATQISLGMMFLCVAPAFLIGFPLVWYTVTWKLCFDANGITNSVLGFRGKIHGYQEIQDAVCRYSSSDSAMIVRIVFDDGNSVKFRMGDENALKAQKHLLSRHSIREI